MSSKDATQISDRTRLRAYFVELFRAEPGVDPRLAERLAERCVRRVKRVVVWKAPREADAERAARDPAAATRRTPDCETTAPPPAAAEPPVPPPAEPAPAAVSLDARPAPAAAPEPADADPVEPAFDPYAFSAVVVLTKSGPDALMQRLVAITRAEHLVRLAEAQRLAVGRDVAEIDELRRAIVAAAQQRIRNRRAAAS